MVPRNINTTLVNPICAKRSHRLSTSMGQAALPNRRYVAKSVYDASLIPPYSSVSPRSFPLSFPSPCLSPPPPLSAF